MSRINPRLVYWIAALHDDAQLKAAHRDILTYLAVKRLDFGTGAGYCSVESLVKGTDWSEATVKRALDVAQKAAPPLLKRTRRGHRLGNGESVASEWQVLYPPTSTAHECDVEKGQQRTDATLRGLNSSEAGSQQLTPEPPTGSESSTGDDDARTAAKAAVAREFDWPLEHAGRVTEAVMARAKDPVTDATRYVLAAVRKSPASWAPDAARWHPATPRSGRTQQPRSRPTAGIRRCQHGYPVAADDSTSCQECDRPPEEAIP